MSNKDKQAKFCSGLWNMLLLSSHGIKHRGLCNYTVSEGPTCSLGTCLRVLNVKTQRKVGYNWLALSFSGAHMLVLRATGRHWVQRNGKIRTSIKHFLHPRPAWNLPTYTRVLSIIHYTHTHTRHSLRSKQGVLAAYVQHMCGVFLLITVWYWLTHTEWIKRVPLDCGIFHCTVR